MCVRSIVIYLPSFWKVWADGVEWKEKVVANTYVQGVRLSLSNLVREGRLLMMIVNKVSERCRSAFPGHPAEIPERANRNPW